MISRQHYLRLLAGGLLLAGCAGASPDPEDVLHVAVAFYPLEYLAEQLAGADAVVTNVTPPGVEPHDLDLAPADVAVLTEADLVLYLHGFQPALDAVAGGMNGVDLLEAGVADPHVWVNPAQMRGLAQRVAAEISEADPQGADEYAANAAALAADLDALDREYAAALSTCSVRTLVVSHAAFGHLAAAYGFEQLPISGVDPEDEPAPAELEAVTDAARAAGVTTVYTETLLNTDLASTVAAEIGAGVAVLDPLEGLDAEAIAAGADYASVMRENLRTLVAGQGC